MLNKILFITLIIAVFSNCTLISRIGSNKICSGKDLYQIDYNTYGFSDEHFVTLDSASSLSVYECNIDATEIKLTFDNVINKNKFVTIINVPDTFIIENDKFGCKDQQNIRRFISIETQTETSVTIRVVPTRYDEIFQNAEVSIKKINSNDDSCNAQKRICIGVNTVTCNSPYQSIEIYKNQYIDISCIDCYAGLSFDIFLDISIHLWHLETLSTGFKNIQLNGANIFDLNAHYSWSAGVRKDIEIVQPTVIVSFYIGPIPIKIWFDVKLDVSADASFVATADAKVGVTMLYDIGDMYATWTPSTKWMYTKPSPKFTYTPVLSGDANFKGTLDIQLTPSINAHLNNIASFSLIFPNSANFQVYGSGSIIPAEAQICAKASGELKCVSESELQINVGFIHINGYKDEHVFYDIPVTIFPEKCVKV